jgi:4-diphosphocytidyl-2-C-methyl-D-erythritol kinase
MSNSLEGVLLGAGKPWPAPAKLNLCLHIVGRRADGYHMMQSALQFIDLCDELAFYARPNGIIERIHGPADVPAEKDLVIRAAQLLAKHTRVDQGVGISLKKKIPLQAGLGGGSSDAATVLVALNALWRTALPIDELAQLGLALGADVPVFVRGQAAWVEGVGEQLTAQDFKEVLYVLIKPAANVSTAEIFQAAELTRNSPITTIRAFLAGGGRNDCTSTVRARYPDIAEALDWLGKFGSAKMTGTGACVFAEVSDERAGESVLAQLPAQWRGFLVRSVNRSPLLDRLAEERIA